MSGLLSRFHLRHGSVTSTGTGSAEHRSATTERDSLEPNDRIQSDVEDDNSSINPFPPAQRRRRSESLDFDDQRAEKRQKQFATTLCTAKGFPEDALDDFIGLSHAEMMISIRAELLEMQMQGRKSKAERFIESDDFKDIMKDRLLACLLSPNLPAYVVGLGDQAFARKNIQMFKIPEAVLNDPEMSEKVITLIKDILTSQRSNMKQKLANHITSKSHISVLTKSLAPSGGYEITAGHWARIAFLRDSLNTFPSVVEESRARAQERARQGPDDAASSEESADEGKKALKNKIWTYQEFWNYVDILLRELRLEARKLESSPIARAKHIEMFFTRCLQADLRKYPGTISSPAIPAFDKVTVPWQKLIYTGLVW